MDPCERVNEGPHREMADRRMGRTSHTTDGSAISVGPRTFEHVTTPHPTPSNAAPLTTPHEEPVSPGHTPVPSEDTGTRSSETKTIKFTRANQQMQEYIWHQLGLDRQII